MTCPRCRTIYEESRGRCPRCGTVRGRANGTFQTSTVLISAGGREMVFRSVEEVPSALRTQLLRSTNGAYSATILIADRRGRQQIARAMRKLPGAPARRLIGPASARRRLSEAPAWLTPARRRAIFTLLILATLMAIGLVFGRQW